MLNYLKQFKQAEDQSEAAKKRELQRKMEQLRAEISLLDSQISGTEEQLATQGQALLRRTNNFLKSRLLLSVFEMIFFYTQQCFVFLTEQSIDQTWAQVEDSHRRELVLQAFRQRCIMGQKLLHDDASKIEEHCQALEQMAK